MDARLSAFVSHGTIETSMGLKTIRAELEPYRTFVEQIRKKIRQEEYNE